MLVRGIEIYVSCARVSWHTSNRSDNTLSINVERFYVFVVIWTLKGYFANPNAMGWIWILFCTNKSWKSSLHTHCQELSAFRTGLDQFWDVKWPQCGVISWTRDLMWRDFMSVTINMCMWNIFLFSTDGLWTLMEQICVLKAELMWNDFMWLNEDRWEDLQWDPWWSHWKCGGIFCFINQVCYVSWWFKSK